MKKYVLLPAIAVFTAAVLGCGNSPPELNQVYSQLNYIYNPLTDQIRTEFTVLFNAEDEDGEDDIESMYVIRERSEKLWTADSSEWDKRSSRGLNWNGAQRLLTEDGSIPDSGEYRLLLTDLAGESTEESLFLQPVEKAPSVEAFPAIVFTAGDYEIEIESPDSSNVISFYDSESKLIAAYNVTPGFIEIKKLKDGNAVYENYRTVQLGFYSNSSGAGHISGPWLRPESE